MLTRGPCTLPVCPAHSAALSEPVREVIVHMRKCCRMTPASIALCIPSPRSMVEGASAARTLQVRTMGVLLPARGLASRRICVRHVRCMMLVKYIQISPARSLFWRVVLLGGDGANESSSAGRAGQGTGAGRGSGVVRGAAGARGVGGGGVGVVRCGVHVALLSSPVLA